MTPVNIRAATIEDAPNLAFLINLAGENLPMVQWRQMAGAEEDPLQVGAVRAARTEGDFSFRNAKVAEIDGTLVGMVLSYRLPDPYDPGATEDLPAIIRPLVLLESEAPGTWYINAIATYAEQQGRGVGSSLMAHCETMANDAGVTHLSLIVASENTGAHALYLKLGYQDVSSLPLVTYPEGPTGGDWVLMTKPVA
ncbi:MAG: GNAT family N-acetyltransferase [Pseudomonadota bacterium]